jgi:hypothetical protein
VSNTTERKAVAELLYSAFADYADCLRALGQTWHNADTAHWGAGTYSAHAHLSGLRKAAEVIGLRLGLEDLDRVDQERRANHTHRYAHRTG